MTRLRTPLSEPAEPRHPELVRTLAVLYRDQLRRNRSAMSRVGETACGKLIETIELALDTEGDLDPRGMTFGSRSLDGIEIADRPLFVNQYILGIGSDGAQFIVMGTEAADDHDADNPEELAFHCLFAALQLAGGRLEVLRRIAAGATWEGRVKRWDDATAGTTSEPNDLLELDMRRSRTWRVVAEVAAGSLDRSDWGPLVTPRRPGPGLGAFAYQIERSARSALQADLGGPPSDARIAFLVDEVLPTLRPSSDTLILPVSEGAAGPSGGLGISG